jgi:hypothetical protein
MDAHARVLFIAANMHAFYGSTYVRGRFLRAGLLQAEEKVDAPRTFYTANACTFIRLQEAKSCASEYGVSS